MKELPQQIRSVTTSVASDMKRTALNMTETPSVVLHISVYL
jgi:hypothetical protein